MNSSLDKLEKHVRDRYKKEQEKINIQNTRKEVEAVHSQLLREGSPAGLTYNNSSTNRSAQGTNYSVRQRNLSSPLSGKKYRCPILGCAINLSSSASYQVHVSQTEAQAHSPCNPLKHLTDARLDPNTTGHVCPVCGELYRNFVSCNQHMKAMGHDLLQEPLALAGYICPQCLEVYPDQSACSEHMDKENHCYVQYPFSDDLERMDRVLPVPLPKTTLLLYLEKCATVECSFVDQKTVCASMSHGEVFAFLLKNATCVQCLRLFNELPIDDVIHNCSHTIRGMYIENDCKSFAEFIRRLGLKPILPVSNTARNEDNQAGAIYISDDEDDVQETTNHCGTDANANNNNSQVNKTRNSGYFGSLHTSESIRQGDIRKVCDSIKSEGLNMSNENRNTTKKVFSANNATVIKDNNDKTQRINKPHFTMQTATDLSNDVNTTSSDVEMKDATPADITSVKNEADLQITPKQNMENDIRILDIKVSQSLSNKAIPVDVRTKENLNSVPVQKLMKEVKAVESLVNDKSTNWMKVGTCQRQYCVCEVLTESENVSSSFVCITSEATVIDFIQIFKDNCLVVERNASISKVYFWFIFKQFWYSQKTYRHCIDKNMLFGTFYKLDAHIMKTSKFIHNYKVAQQFLQSMTPTKVNLPSFTLAKEFCADKNITTTAASGSLKKDFSCKKRKNDTVEKMDINQNYKEFNPVPKKLNFTAKNPASTYHEEAPTYKVRKVDSEPEKQAFTLKSLESDNKKMGRNMKRRIRVKLANELSKCQKKSLEEENADFEGSGEHMDISTRPFKPIVIKPIEAPASCSKSSIQPFNYASAYETYVATLKKLPLKTLNFSNSSVKFTGSDKCYVSKPWNNTKPALLSTPSSKSYTYYSNSTKSYDNNYVPNKHDKVFSSNLQKFTTAMKSTCTKLNDLHIEGKSFHRQNIVPDNLHVMKHVIFLDVDNWSKFFQKLPKCLPHKTFVWGFYGGATQWIEPYNCPAFAAVKHDNCFHLHSKCGNRKDSADFAICMWVGRMDERLPKHIPFTILSGDKGFNEIEAQMNSSDRRAVVVNPHHETPEGVYSLVVSVAETHISDLNEYGRSHFAQQNRMLQLKC